MGRFKDELLRLRQKIRDNYEDKMVKRVSIPQFSPRANPFQLTEGAEALVSKLNAAVQVDIHAYQPTPEPGIHLHPANVKNLTGDFASSTSGADLSKPLVRDMILVVEPLPADLEERHNALGCFLADVDLRSSYFPRKDKSIFDQQTKEKMGLDNQLLFRFLHGELDIARDNPDAYQSRSKVVQQLQRIASMYTQGNVANTMTAFQTLQGEHPNDKLVSFVAAHIFFHRAAHGHSQFLPKARQEAKKAAAGHDKVHPNVLTRFRYHLTTIDTNFGQDRLLDLLRDYKLLTPPEQQHTDSANFAFYLKAMILLSRTDVKQWTEKEVRAVCTLAEEVIGGGFIYNAFFFEKLQDMLFNKNDDTSEMFRPLLDIHVKFAGIESGLASFREARKEMGAVNEGAQSPAYRWTISQELFKKCLAYMPIPEEEDVLMNISLNGEMFTPTESLDQTIREHEMMIGPFWPVWIGKLIPVEGIYAPNNLPDQIARSEVEFLPDFEALVETLKEEENSRIDQEKWQYTHPYQTQYSYDRIVSAGIGRTYTKLTFAPQNPVLKSHYEVWGSDAPRGLLYSEIVAQKAEESGFAGIKEIMGFFDGVLKIIGDAEYGLAAKQKQAWETYMKKQQALQGGGSGGSGNYLQRLLAELWWFFVFVIPGALAAFLVVSSSSGLSGALKIFILILVVLGFGLGLVVALVQGSKVEKDIQRSRIHLDEEGNVISRDEPQPPEERASEKPGQDQS